MDTKFGTVESPPGWLEFLTESQHAVENGDIVPLEPVLQRMRDAIAHLDAEQATVAHPEA